MKTYKKRGKKFGKLVQMQKKTYLRDRQDTVQSSSLSKKGTAPLKRCWNNFLRPFIYFDSCMTH